MSMKFGLLTDVDLRKRVTSSDTKPEVGLVSSRRGRHIETVYDVISPPWVARFGRNLGICFRIVRKLLRSGQNCKGKNSIPTAIENRSLSYFCFFFPMQFGLRRAAAFISSPIHLSIHGKAFHRASSEKGRQSTETWTAWMREGERASFWFLNICCKQSVLFRATWPQKQAFFQSHPQSTEENAWHF